MQVKQNTKLKIDSSRKSKSNLPDLDTFLSKRDFSGALTLLEFQNFEECSLESHMWIAYTAFHKGDYEKAISKYEQLTKAPGADPDIHTYLACCYYCMGRYDEAMSSIIDGSAVTNKSNPLLARLRLHIAIRKNDEHMLLKVIESLGDSIEDQLSLACIHYLRNNHQEALEIYKKILLDNRESYALHVYIAQCYYKLDYFDVSQELLDMYIQRFPESATALIVKSCLDMRRHDWKEAEIELKGIQKRYKMTHDSIRNSIQHNLDIIKSNNGSLQTQPKLFNNVRVSHLNSIIWHLKKAKQEQDPTEMLERAEQLANSLNNQPTPIEYIVKGVVHALLAQKPVKATATTKRLRNNRSVARQKHLKLAHEAFQLVGGSSSECDTVAGRQCIASCFFLLNEFSNSLIYLDTIRSHFTTDPTFNANYIQAKAKLGLYEEALQAFKYSIAQPMEDSQQHDWTVIKWLARCYVMTEQPQLAWDLYVRASKSATMVTDLFDLLQLIANDCYRVGQFFYAAKAFDLLEQLGQEREVDNEDAANDQYWLGLRGSCVGVFQLVLAGKESRERLQQSSAMLAARRQSSREESRRYECDSILRLIGRWVDENRIVTTTTTAQQQHNNHDLSRGGEYVYKKSYS